jgi:ribonuclease Z
MGQMDFTFLGTTAAVPSVRRGHTGIAIRYEDEVILWDCGEGTQRQLIKSGISFMRINKIFITHLHGDHFLGIPGLVQTISFSDRTEPIYIYGPEGTEKVIQAVRNLGEYRLHFDLVPVEMDGNFTLEEKKYRIKAIPVDHYIPAYGLVFEEKKARTFLREKAEALGIPPGPLYSKLHRGEPVEVGGRVIDPEEVLGEPKEGYKLVYSSDTRPLDVIKEACRGAVLVHDSTFDDEYRENALETKHSTASEAAAVAKEGGAKALYLTHISPRYKDGKVLYEQAKKIFPEATLAKDLMRVDMSWFKAGARK